MALNQKKRQFIGESMNRCSIWIDMVDVMQTLSQQWTDEFKSGKANEVTQADLDELGLGITVTDLSRIGAIGDNMVLLRDGGDPAVADYGKFIRALMNSYS